MAGGFDHGLTPFLSFLASAGILFYICSYARASQYGEARPPFDTVNLDSTVVATKSAVCASHCVRHLIRKAQSGSTERRPVAKRSLYFSTFYSGIQRAWHRSHHKKERAGVLAMTAATALSLRSDRTKSVG